MPDELLGAADDPGEPEIEVESERSSETEPAWAEYRFRKEHRKNERMERALNAERAEKAALQSQLAMFNERVAKLENPESAQAKGPTYSELVKFKQDYEELRNRVLLDPADEEAKDQLRKVKPEHLVTVDLMLADHKASERSSGVQKDMQAKADAGQFKAALQTELHREFGPDVLDMTSDLMIEAAEQYRTLMGRHRNDDNGAVTWMAVEKAAMKLGKTNRDGRELSDGDRRRLAIEGSGRREAAPSNQIAALKKKGDWQSAAKANSLEMDSFLKRLYGS